MDTTISQDLRFIYFDLDDTLLDHKAAEKAALLYCHDQLAMFDGLQPEELVSTYRTLNKQLWEAYGTGDIDRITLSKRRFEGTLERLGLSDPDPDAFGQVYISVYRKYWGWVPGAKMTWEKVRSQWPAGIITNGFADLQKEKFKRFGFDLSADALVISEEVGYMKPHPAIFEHSAQLAGVSPEQILYVGDSPGSDMKGAAAAGYRTAWFVRDPYENADQVPADFVFEDFGQLGEWLEL
jgi:putative hydrolase of the HAD superfamily